jgi:hypothetical protein
MRKIYLLLLMVPLFVSCKKSYIEATAASQSVTANIITQPCFYTKLEPQPDGSYTCLWEGMNVMFRNLTIRQGGFLYGDLHYVPNAVVVSGEQSRTFAIKAFYCAVSGPMVTVSTRSISYQEFRSKTTANTYAWYGNSTSGLGSFLIDIANTLDVGEIDFTVTPMTYTVRTYRIGEGITMDCTKSKVVTGKLVVKSILTPTGYTYEYGVANLCYEDKPKMLDPID